MQEQSLLKRTIKEILKIKISLDDFANGLLDYNIDISSNLDFVKAKEGIDELISVIAYDYCDKDIYGIIEDVDEFTLDDSVDVIHEYVLDCFQFELEREKQYDEDDKTNGVE